MYLDSTQTQDNPAIALGVIDADLAGPRRWRYALNIEGHARQIGADLAETLIIDEHETDLRQRILDGRERTGATLIIAPSLRHLHGVHQDLTAWAELHVIGRSHVYPRGHPWT